MPDEIELRAMNDHDLIVISVMQGNETVRHLKQINNTIEKHEKRIGELETSPYCENNRLSKKQIVSVGGGSIGIAAIIYYLIQLLVNAYGG